MKRLSAHTRKRCDAVGFYLATAAAMYVLCVLDPKLGPGRGPLFGALLMVPVAVGLARGKPHAFGFIVRGDWRAFLDIGAFLIGGAMSALLLWQQSWAGRAGGLVVLAAGAAVQWRMTRAPQVTPPTSPAA